MYILRAFIHISSKRPRWPLARPSACAQPTTNNPTATLTCELRALIVIRLSERWATPPAAGPVHPPEPALHCSRCPGSHKPL
eukprot:scaffold23495_cov112-Isochrysis_galbana.AAC.3